MLYARGLLRIVEAEAPDVRGCRAQSVARRQLARARTRRSRWKWRLTRLAIMNAEQREGEHQREEQVPAPRHRQIVARRDRQLSPSRPVRRLVEPARLIEIRAVPRPNRAADARSEMPSPLPIRMNIATALTQCQIRVDERVAADRRCRGRVGRSCSILRARQSFRLHSRKSSDDRMAFLRTRSAATACRTIRSTRSSRRARSAGSARCPRTGVRNLAPYSFFNLFNYTRR